MCDLRRWLHESQFAGPALLAGYLKAVWPVFYWCHDMAVELLCRADFVCNRHCKTSPVVLEGFWGQAWPKFGRKPTRKFPARLLSGTQAYEKPINTLLEPYQNPIKALSKPPVAILAQVILAHSSLAVSEFRVKP
jgi:hypothetical protein